MKQSYEIPEISVVTFNNDDIVTTSGGLQSAIQNYGNGSDNDVAWDFLNN